MRKLMEMSMGQRFVFVIMYGDTPVKASMESNFANSYAEEYRKLVETDPNGPKEVTVHQVGLGPDNYGE